MIANYYKNHSLDECKHLIQNYADKYNVNIIQTYTIYPAKALSTVNNDNSYTVLLLPDLTYDEKIKEILHELNHIINDDFHSDLTADEIEYKTHALDS